MDGGGGSCGGGYNEVQRTMLEIVNQLDGFDARGNFKVWHVLLHMEACSCTRWGRQAPSLRGRVGSLLV
jgi:hypothetical protein